MTIGIIGLGVVGSAVYESFKIKCIDETIVAYDKFKSSDTFENVCRAAIIFLCLPTPYSASLKCYDKSAIDEVCAQLAAIHYNGWVVIKSTVEPGTCQLLADTYRLAILHNPEFLSAQTAFTDFNDQSHIVIGHTNNVASHLVYFYQKYYPAAQLTTCHATESECIKLFCNNFYAVKIQFFNELYLLCQKIGVDYQIIREGMLRNHWLSPMHTNVPGNDNQLSYGGLCFPKDTNALLQYMIKQDTCYQVLEATVKERSSMRPDE